MKHNYILKDQFLENLEGHLIVHIDSLHVCRAYAHKLLYLPESVLSRIIKHRVHVKYLERY